MAEQLPPPDHMIPELRSSDHTLSFFRELVARDSPRFIALNPIKRGTPYAIGKGADAKTVRDFPSLFFLRQTVPIGSNTVAGMTQSNLVIWEWLSSSPDAENVENAEISLLGDAVANPVYARVSTVRRSIYEANPTLTPGTATLTGLIGIKVTNGGSGYTSAPTVAISGGLGATAEAVIDAAGTVTHVIITKESSGYDSASLPTISFSGGGGTGAAATAIVQPKTAVLTSQRKREFPDGDPRSLELVQILRTYEVLPGPDIVTVAITDGGERITTTKTRSLASSITPSNTVSGGIWTRVSKEAIDDSSIVAWKVTVTQTDVFSRLFFSKTRDDTIPERFKATVPAITTKAVLQGVASAPTLATGDLFRSEQQIDAFTYERTITNRDISSLPTLEGQKYDEQLNIFIPYTEELVAAGTALGDANTEVAPLGGGLDLVTIYDLSAIQAELDTYLLEFPGTANLNLPDELVSVSCTMEKSTGDGSYQTDSVYGEWTDHGSSSASIRGSGQGSAAIMPFVLPILKEHPATNVPTTNSLFFLPAPVTIADILAKVSASSTWPKFRPQSATIVAVGRRVSLQANVDASAHDAGDESGAHSLSYSNGHGTSREIGMSLSATHIPPTIHGSIGISGTTSDSETVNATAACGGSGLMGDISESVSETETIAASVSSSGLGATSGDTSVPTTGVYLRDSNCEPYRFGYVRVHAETVDFADV